MTRVVAALMGLSTVVALAACEREHRAFDDPQPPPPPMQTVAMSELHPGGASQPPLVPSPYDENAYAVSEGKRLYQQWNCVGCHAWGGGGMGPALMDDEWIYGSAPANIFATIIEGRPNGMPSFRGKIPDDQVWQIVAYVRSLSGLLRASARSGRSDHMQIREQDQGLEKQRPKLSTVPSKSEKP